MTIKEEGQLNFNLGIDNMGKHLNQSRYYSVGDILQKNARVQPNETGIVSQDGERITYGELNERVNRLANAFISRGLDNGASIAVVSENRPEFVEVMFAGAKIGALVPTQNWRLERVELCHCLELTKPDAVVFSGKNVDKAEWVQESDEMSPGIIVLDDADIGTDYEYLIKENSTTEPEPARYPHMEDGAVVLYTSGTTGLPKGAVISHRALINRGMLWSWLVNMKAAPDFVGWNPMFHMAGMELLMGVMINGGTFYTVDSFQLERILECQREANANYLAITPSTLESFFEYAEKNEWDPDEYGVEIMGAMADLYNPKKLQRITKLFEADFLNSYGSTEAGLGPGTGNVIPAGSKPSKEELAKKESPLYEVKLVDEAWNEVDQGETGEAAVRGPALLSGYINDPDANRSEFKEGWFRTGDLFRRDEEGLLHYADRRKYLIKSGGENIYPAEIERNLVDHPDITESCVVRIPDEKWGEVPMAYISTTDGTDLTSEDVLNFLSDRIARYKLPHYIDFLNEDEYPRGTSGEISRTELEEWNQGGKRVRNPNS